jgi:hypothetical protein
MRVHIRIKRILLFLLFVVLLTGPSWALLIGASSWYDGYTIFDGTLDNGKTAKVAIEFAVFNQSYVGDNSKTGLEEFEDVFASMGVDAPDTSGFENFIYAYKIFNFGNEEDSDDMISAFSILNLDEQTNGIVGLGAHDDGTDGAEPSTYGFEDGDCVWQWFQGEGGLRFIELSDQSWLLVLSSVNDWVKGEYELRGTDDSDLPAPGEGEIPEPAVIALLGAGSCLLRRRHRRTTGS